MIFDHLLGQFRERLHAQAIGAFFEIDCGYQYPIAELTRLSPLENSLKLQLVMWTTGSSQPSEI
ncbi:hypothetical protein PAXRUDRAFT_21389 [Paxillus rubicundulus Ve08.2h10]|uniref:Uncharacterized protein n=1 Tax=Paxillus rubicundulus Ve08.2h10 TaxID=930991 RepID=A0A0D0CQ92_9AGAM|nr:hypothetical protein PAXRUDRAFT_21389 [Paxillus rubicundulus Ve08.2h10]